MSQEFSNCFHYSLFIFFELQKESNQYKLLPNFVDSKTKVRKLTSRWLLLIRSPGRWGVMFLVVWNLKMMQRITITDVASWYNTWVLEKCFLFIIFFRYFHDECLVCNEECQSDHRLYFKLQILFFSVFLPFWAIINSSLFSSIMHASVYPEGTFRLY